MENGWKKFKEKLESKPYSAEDADWTAMRQVLEHQPQPGGSFQWLSSKAVLWMSGLVAVIVTVSWFYFSDGQFISEQAEAEEAHYQPADSGEGEKPASPGESVPAESISSFSLPMSAGAGFSEQEMTDGTASAPTGNRQQMNADPVKPAVGGSLIEEKASLGKAQEDKRVMPLQNNKEQLVFLNQKPVAVDGKALALRELENVGAAKSAPIFRISGVSLSGIHSQGLAPNAPWKQGLGVEVDLSSGTGFFLNVGAFAMEQVHRYFDSTLSVDAEPWQEQRIDSTWVMDAPFSGYYEYDTVWLSGHDTIYNYRQNSSLSERYFRYTELPLYAGYQWHKGRWRFACAAGIIPGWGTNQRSGEDHRAMSWFQTDVSLRPSVSYALHSNWEVLLRTGWRRTIYSKGLPENWNSGDQVFLQAGLTYRW